MAQLVDLLGFFVIVLMLFMQWQIYVTRVITTFAVSSIMIAASLIFIGIQTDETPSILVGVLTAVVRGITIPVIVVRSLHTEPHRAREQRPVVSTATSIFISLGLVLFSYALYTLGIGNAIELPSGFLPLALLFQGGFLIISRRNAFIQLAGYLSMENAVLLFGSLVFPGIPFIVEAGVVLDLLGVVVVSRIIMRLRESTEVDGSYGHKELRG